MRTNYLDLAPLRKATVGFDRLFDFINKTSLDTTDNYPPFDVEKQGEDRYQIRLALAGFAPDDVEVVLQENALTVRGRKEQDAEPTGRYLHRGIATRSFERRFQLADYVQVESANMNNGVLAIALKREVPESKKPHRIAVSSEAPAAVEHHQERETEAV